MSKKNFVTIALSLNVIICVILCALYFNGYGEKDRADNDIKDITGNMAESDIPENTKGNQQTTDEPDSTEETDAVKEPDTIQKPGTTKEPVTTKTQETTKEAVTTKESETTTDNSQIGEQTTVPAFLEGKTTAVITGDCNVRDADDVSGNVTGVARAGQEYVIDRSKSTSYWIALVYNGSIGYVYIEYCTFK